MTEQSTLTVKNAPEKFVVGEWVDFRQRVEVNRWEGRAARVTRVNGLEVYVDIDGNVNEPMAFFPRRSDGKHVRMISRNGSVPDYEFAPTWIYHGRVAENFANVIERTRIEGENKESRRGFLDSLRRLISDS